jgi:DNA-binding transcriptional LysR family regulator
MIALTIPHALAAPSIVGASDMAALLPHRLAAAFAEMHRLKLFKPPYPSPAFEVTALWHQGHGSRPAVAWLRTRRRYAAAALLNPSPLWGWVGWGLRRQAG